MPSSARLPQRLVQRGTALLSLLAATAALLIAAAPAPAEAAPSLGYRAVSEASHHSGQPYVYGAAGPTRFDCSGFTLYVFSRFGYRLPHNAAAQYNAVRHVPRSSLRVGDLLFFNGGGGIGHVGIYAGNGRMWHAPHSGDVVRLDPVYSSSFLVGRLG